MTTQDDQFAKKITGYLDESTAAMRAGTAYRLQLARQQALARLASPERVKQPGLAHAVAGGGATTPGTNKGGRDLWQNGKLWLGIGLIAAAAFGYQGYLQWQAQQQIKDLEETDAAILSSDLPIDAYLDRGFQNWLKHLDE